jgi:hypothetical protein
MAANEFDTTTRVPTNQGKLEENSATGNGGVTNNEWIIGGRLLPSGQTYLAPVKPASGIPLYEYYRPYLLPAQYNTDSQALLSYFQSAGFTVQSGYTNTTTLYDASSVVVGDGILTVTFENINDSTSALIDSLTNGDQITGTWVSGVNSGVYVSCSVIDDNAVLVLNGDSGDISVGGNVTLTFTDTEILYPDVLYTDPFVVLLFYAVLVNSLLENTDNTNFISPNIWFTILPDSGHTQVGRPQAAPFTGITAPTSVTGSGSSTVLQIPTASSTSTNPVGYIPFSKLGVSSLSQNFVLTNTLVPDNVNTSDPDAVVLSFLSGNANIAVVNKIIANQALFSGEVNDTTNPVNGTYVSAAAVTGTYAAQIIISVADIGDMVTGDSFVLDLEATVTGVVNNSYLSGNYIICNMVNVEGTFLTDQALVLQLDVSQSIFSLLKTKFALQQLSLQYFNIPGYVTSASSLSVTYKDYTDFVVEINAATNKTNGQGLAKLIFEVDPSIITSEDTAADTLLAITGSTGTLYYLPIYNNYVNTPADSNSIPIIAGVTSAASAVAFGNNAYTAGNAASISSLVNLLMSGLPCTSPDDETPGATPGLVYADGNVADQIQKAGWNCVCVNSDSIALFPFVITNQLKVNGSPDNALYPEYIFQAVDYIMKGLLYPSNKIYTGGKQYSDEFQALVADLIVDLNQMQTDKVLINTATNNKYLNVKQNSTNPFLVNETLVIQVYAAILGFLYTINLYGSNLTVTASPVSTF